MLRNILIVNNLLPYFGKQAYITSAPTFLMEEHIQMNDAQWRELAGGVLPDEARAAIEAEIDTYNRFAAAKAPQPHQVRTRYERIAKLAGDLLDELKALPDAGLPVATPALSEVEGATKAGVVNVATITTKTPRLDVLKTLTERYDAVERLRDWAATTATKIEKAKTGSDARNARALVKRADLIFEKYTGKPLNRGKVSMIFLSVLGRRVTPALDVGTMEGALKEHLSRTRG
jgi:hypothetical protein